MSELMLRRVPAVNLSSARAFPLGVEITSEHSALLTTAGGAVRVRWDIPTALFATGSLAFGPVSPAASRAFVDDLAAWLRVRPMREADRTESTLTTEIVSLGSGQEAVGFTWDGFKLFFSAGNAEDRYAEIFFRLSPARDQAQFLEKWGAYATRIPALLEIGLGVPVRSWEALAGPPTCTPPPEPTLEAGEVAAVHAGVIAFAVPVGWTHRSVPGGSSKWADPTDEFEFEVSALRVPPGAKAADVLAFCLNNDANAKGAAVILTSHDRLDVATAHHGWRSADPHRDGEMRDARTRWIVAVEGTNLALITFNYWADDATVALPHSDRALQTLVVQSP